MIFVWFLISVPLCIIGAYKGHKRPIRLPVQTNFIPRNIPNKQTFRQQFLFCMALGALPFGVCFTELFFILGSIWQHKFYYLFGFLTVILMLCVITCMLVSIAVTYFRLLKEDYLWWWRSFWATGCSGIWVCVFILFSRFVFFSLCLTNTPLNSIAHTHTFENFLRNKYMATIKRSFYIPHTG